MLGYNHHHINDDDAGQMMTKKLSVKAVPRRRTLLRTPEGSHQTATQLLQQCENSKGHWAPFCDVHTVQYHHR